MAAKLLHPRRPNIHIFLISAGGILLNRATDKVVALMCTIAMKIMAIMHLQCYCTLFLNPTTTACHIWRCGEVVWQSTTLVHVAGASKSLQQTDYYLCEGKFDVFQQHDLYCPSVYA